MTIAAEMTYSLRSYRRIQLATYRARVWGFRVFGAIFVVGGALMVTPAAWTVGVMAYGLFLFAWPDLYSLYTWPRFRRSGTTARFELSPEGVRVIGSGAEAAIMWTGFSSRKVDRDLWTLTMASSRQRLGIPRWIFATADQERIDWLVRGITPVDISEHPG